MALTLVTLHPVRQIRHGRNWSDHRHTGHGGHPDSTLAVHVGAVTLLLLGGVFWWRVLAEPFFDFPPSTGPLAGVVFVTLAVLAALRPGFAHLVVWLATVTVPLAAFVTVPFAWPYVALVMAVFSVPCSVVGGLLHSTMRRLAADSLARRA